MRYRLYGLAVSATLAVFGITCLSAPRCASASIVADSSADFSGTQGQDNWYYGYYNRTQHPGTIQTSDFEQLIWDGYWRTDTAAIQPPWTSIFGGTGDGMMHPNGPYGDGPYGEELDVHWVTRRWVSEVSGPVEVNWAFSKYQADWGNGVTGLVYLNGTLLDSATIVFNDLVGYTNKLTVNVHIGDNLEFMVSPRGTFDFAFSEFPDESGYDNLYVDGTVLTATVATVPEPASIAVWSLLGMVGIGCCYWRKRKQ